MVYCLLAGLAGAAGLFFLPLRLWFDYRHSGKSEDSLFIQFSVLNGLFCHTLTVPAISARDKGLVFTVETAKTKKHLGFPLSSPPGAGWVLRYCRAWWRLWQRIVGLFKRGFKVRRFVWHTEFGGPDCHHLALIAGVLWAVKGLVYAGLNHYFAFTAPPVIEALPRFNRKCFRLTFSCILEFPLGYAMIAAFFAGTQAMKFQWKRRGDSDERTSDPRPDEDSHG